MTTDGPNRGFWPFLRAAFGRGLVLVIPLVITWWILNFLFNTLEQLAQATHDHLEWHANLLRVIVCQLPCNPNDLTTSALHRCRFGNWYYERAAAELQGQPAFAAIGIEHQRIHEVGAWILREIAAGRPVDRRAFDRLLEGSLRLRRELDLLKG